jgi:hypothetical protein
MKIPELYMCQTGSEICRIKTYIARWCLKNTVIYAYASVIFLQPFPPGFLCTVLYTNVASSTDSQIPLVSEEAGMMGSNTGMLRFWHWQSDALTGRLYLFH